MISTCNLRALQKQGLGPLTRRNQIVPAFTRSINNAELTSFYKKVEPSWFRRRGAKAGYPSFFYPNGRRIIGVDKNLQERLDDMFREEQEGSQLRLDIGFESPKQETPMNSRKKMIEFVRKQRNNRELEKAARLKELEVTLSDVKKEHLTSGGLFKEIFDAADLYGIYEDLYGKEKYFNPCVHLNISFDYDEEFVTPVYRGNIIKPSEAKSCPNVSFEIPKFLKSEVESLWTLVLTNLDGHFTQENSEYLHWFVGNIPGNNVAAGQTICDYLQPFPAHGTGYHRFVFVLYKQSEALDFSEYSQHGEKVDLAQRTFKTPNFIEKFDGQLKPAGLAFFQSDWDSSLKSFFHEVLEMREPKFEYNFIPQYIRPWLTKVPNDRSGGFNFFLDMQRDPKEIQEEVLKKKLKTVHPFKGDLERHKKFPNAHGPQIHRYQDENKYGAWRLREIERERLRQGIFKDMDWSHLRRDPTEA